MSNLADFTLLLWLCYSLKPPSLAPTAPSSPSSVRATAPLSSHTERGLAWRTAPTAPPVTLPPTPRPMYSPVPPTQPPSPSLTFGTDLAWQRNFSPLYLSSMSLLSPGPRRSPLPPHDQRRGASNNNNSIRRSKSRRPGVRASIRTRLILRVSYSI